MALKQARAAQQLMDPGENGNDTPGIGAESYATWEDAQASSNGYDDRLISERALAGALAVKRGEAAFERDTVLFHSPAHRWQLLACIASVAASNKGHIHLLDIGGSFASTYLQHLIFFRKFSNLRWSVIEQPHMVAAGRRHLQDEQLFFFDTMEEASAIVAADMVVFSGSLQFMREPYAFLARASRTGCSHILIDRITLPTTTDDRITVYKVFPDIYPGSYPQWVLSERKLQKFICHELGFKEISRYMDGIDGDDHIGIFFERSNHAD